MSYRIFAGLENVILAEARWEKYLLDKDRGVYDEYGQKSTSKREALKKQLRGIRNNQKSRTSIHDVINSHAKSNEYHGDGALVKNKSSSQASGILFRESMKNKKHAEDTKRNAKIMSSVKRKAASLKNMADIAESNKAAVSGNSKYGEKLGKHVGQLYGEPHTSRTVVPLGARSVSNKGKSKSQSTSSNSATKSNTTVNNQSVKNTTTKTPGHFSKHWGKYAAGVAGLGAAGYGAYKYATRNRD